MMVGDADRRSKVPEEDSRSTLESRQRGADRALHDIWSLAHCLGITETLNRPLKNVIDMYLKVSSAPFSNKETARGSSRH